MHRLRLSPQIVETISSNMYWSELFWYSLLYLWYLIIRRTVKAYIWLPWLNTEKSFRNLIKSNRHEIVFTMHRLIWNKTDIRLVPNQSENGKYNLISGWFNKISERFLWVYAAHAPVRQFQTIKVSLIRSKFISRKQTARKINSMPENLASHGTIQDSP